LMNLRWRANPIIKAALKAARRFSKARQGAFGGKIQAISDIKNNVDSKLRKAAYRLAGHFANDSYFEKNVKRLSAAFVRIQGAVDDSLKKKISKELGSLLDENVYIGGGRGALLLKFTSAINDLLNLLESVNPQEAGVKLAQLHEKLRLQAKQMQRSGKEEKVDETDDDDDGLLYARQSDGSSLGGEDKDPRYSPEKLQEIIRGFRRDPNNCNANWGGVETIGVFVEARPEGNGTPENLRVVLEELLHAGPNVNQNWDMQTVAGEVIKIFMDKCPSAFTPENLRYVVPKISCHSSSGVATDVESAATSVALNFAKVSDIDISKQNYEVVKEILESPSRRVRQTAIEMMGECLEIHPESYINGDNFKIILRSRRIMRNMW